MATVALAYNPNDFFYVTSYSTPSDELCTQMLNNDMLGSMCVNCRNINTSDIDKIIENTTNTDTTTNTPYIGSNGHVFIGNCDLNYFKGMSSNCFPYQLCKNKNLANSIGKIQNNYASSDERYLNIKKEYDYTVLHTINILSGILIISGMTFFYYISE